MKKRFCKSLKMFLECSSEDIQWVIGDKSFECTKETGAREIDSAIVCKGIGTPF